MDAVVYMKDGVSGPLRYRSTGLGKTWTKSRSGIGSQYHFVSDEDAVERLTEKKDCLFHVPGERLEGVLGGSASDAIDSIESGEVDDILDVVLWAERESESRVTVLQAVGVRSDDIEAEIAREQAKSDPSAIDPGEITTRG